MHSLLPTSEYFPVSQAVHAAPVEAPVVPEYVPALQAVHAALDEAPDVTEYVPAGHRLHAAGLSDAYLPAVQMLQAEAPWLYPLLQLHGHALVSYEGELDV